MVGECIWFYTSFIARHTTTAQLRVFKQGDSSKSPSVFLTSFFWKALRTYFALFLPLWLKMTPKSYALWHFGHYLLMLGVVPNYFALPSWAQQCGQQPSHVIIPDCIANAKNESSSKCVITVKVPFKFSYCTELQNSSILWWPWEAPPIHKCV